MTNVVNAPVATPASPVLTHTLLAPSIAGQALAPLRPTQTALPVNTNTALSVNTNPATAAAGYFQNRFDLLTQQVTTQQ